MVADIHPQAAWAMWTCGVNHSHRPKLDRSQVLWFFNFIPKVLLVKPSPGSEPPTFGPTGLLGPSALSLCRQAHSSPCLHSFSCSVLVLDPSYSEVDATFPLPRSLLMISPMSSPHKLLCSVLSLTSQLNEVFSFWHLNCPFVLIVSHGISHSISYMAKQPMAP